MNTTNQNSTAGKSLGTTSMIIGIITLIWSLIPIIGAWALWIAVIGLVLGSIGFVMAKNGGNPKKGIILTGMILSIIAIGVSSYWVYVAKMVVEELVKYN